ncbi:MAG: DegV family protein [Anaerotignum faecicola]
MAEIKAYFESFLKEGKDILHICLPPASGRDEFCEYRKGYLCEKYPNGKFAIVNSLWASSGYGLLMDKLADLRDAGMGIDELRQWVEENKHKVQRWFFCTDLTFYIKRRRSDENGRLCRHNAEYLSVAACEL